MENGACDGTKMLELRPVGRWSVLSLACGWGRLATACLGQPTGARKEQPATAGQASASGLARRLRRTARLVASPAASKRLCVLQPTSSQQRRPGLDMAIPVHPEPRLQLGLHQDRAAEGGRGGEGK